MQTSSPQIAALIETDQRVRAVKKHPTLPKRVIVPKKEHWDTIRQIDRLGAPNTWIADPIGFVRQSSKDAERKYVSTRGVKLLKREAILRDYFITEYGDWLSLAQTARQAGLPNDYILDIVRQNNVLKIHPKVSPSLIFYPSIQKIINATNAPRPEIIINPKCDEEKNNHQDTHGVTSLVKSGAKITIDIPFGMEIASIDPLKGEVFFKPKSGLLSALVGNVGEVYYYIDKGSEVVELTMRSDEVDRALSSIFNYDIDKTRCEQRAKRESARRKLEYIADRLNLSGSNTANELWCIYYGVHLKKFVVSAYLGSYDFVTPNEICFHSKEAAETAIAAMTVEELRALSLHTLPQ